jgi:CspA family cold shock protein
MTPRPPRHTKAEVSPCDATSLVCRGGKAHIRRVIVVRFEPLLLFIRLSVDRSSLTLPGCRILRAASEQESTDMANGTVKFFNSQKGFGFIETDTGGKDVFVHISAVERAGLTGLSDAQKVTFEVETGRDGRESATNLALA